MNLIAQRTDLHHTLTRVSRAITARSTLPILGNVLIEATTGAARLIATDLEIGMRVPLPARVVTPGQVTLPARTLADLVAALPDTDVALALSDHNTVVITSARSQYKLLGLPAEEYPALPEVSGEAWQFPESVLHRTLRSVLPSRSTDDTRPILTAVQWQLIPGHLRLATTDTHRLAVRSAPHDGGGTGTFLLPGNAAQEVLRLIDAGSAEPVTLRVDANQVSFDTREGYLGARLIEGQFPAYEGVIPREWTTRLTLPLAECGQLAKRAAVIARENNNRLTLAATSGVLTLSAQSGDLGAAHEELEVAQEGPDHTCALNVRFFLGALGVLEGERFVLEMGARPVSPVVFREEEGGDWLQVVMPLTRQ